MSRGGGARGAGAGVCGLGVDALAAHFGETAAAWSREKSAWRGTYKFSKVSVLVRPSKVTIEKTFENARIGVAA